MKPDSHPLISTRKQIIECHVKTTQLPVTFAPTLHGQLCSVPLIMLLVDTYLSTHNNDRGIHVRGSCQGIHRRPLCYLPSSNGV